jgi:hypothetical protein
MYSLIALLISASGFSQQSFYSATINDSQLPAKEASFEFSIVPDKIATAFRLYIHNPESKKIKLEISHPMYGVVVDTSFTNDQFSCRYNFEKVEDGNYEITLTSGKEKITRRIAINTVTTRNLLVR